jgi:hypothetical protein
MRLFSACIKVYLVSLLSANYAKFVAATYAVGVLTP